jgi:RIO kinase 2
MESTNGSQPGSEDESEEEVYEDEEGSERGVVEGSERAEVEGDVEDLGPGSTTEESEHEGEEPDGSAELWQGDSEEGKKRQARRGSWSPSSPVGQLGSKVEGTHSVKGLRDKAAIDAYKQRAREKQKHHSRRGADRIGRAKGSKAKQDNRIKLDKGGLWD